MTESQWLILLPAVLLFGAAVGFAVASVRLQSRHTAIAHSLEQAIQLAKLEAASQLAAAEAEARVMREELTLLREAQQQWRVDAREAERTSSLADERLRQLEQMSSQLRQIEAERDQVRGELSLERQRGSVLVARSEEERKGLEQRIDLLQQARAQLSQEFENLAQRIFEEKTQRFAQSSNASLEGVINPLREQLRDFRQKVEEAYDKDMRDRVSLTREIHDLKSLNQTINEQALNLTQALRGSSKVRGNWGEVVLERVLEDSGLRKGFEYETQLSLNSDDGGRRQPDVVVRLPENKDIIIDAKVSLADYERYCEAEDDNARKAALRAHVAAVRTHISQLSFKEYEQLAGIRSLDFVLLFIPIEAAFMLAFEHDQALFRDAYDKNIIVVSPTTLLATLRTISTIWRYERQNQHAEEIALSAGKLHDQLSLVMESLDEANGLVRRAADAIDKVYGRLSSGRGSLVSRVMHLEKLGAKARKRMPESVLARLVSSDVAQLDIVELESEQENNDGT